MIRLQSISRFYPWPGRVKGILAGALIVMAVLSLVAGSSESGENKRAPRQNEVIAVYKPPAVDLDAGGFQSPGISGLAVQDTIYFGGTRWNATESRWEAIEDSCWTFDSGVGSHFSHEPGSYKDLNLSNYHALMEGWVGSCREGVQGDFFRRLETADGRWDTNPICVGSPAGLGGSWSYWAGAFECELGNQGYGNNWDIAISKTLAYPGVGDVVLEFDFAHELELGADFTTVLLDTLGQGCCDPGAKSIANYTGIGSGHANIVIPESELRNSPGPITICFRTTSDGGFSDEDEAFDTACGAFAVDNILVSGAISDFSDFESSENGWLPADSCTPCPDFSDIQHIADLPPVQDTNANCSCCLSDSVLTFNSPSGDEHPLDQDNVAISPVIDLAAAGLAGVPGKFVEACIYGDLPIANGVFIQAMVQWKITSGPCMGQWSPFESTGFIYTTGETPTCLNKFRADFTDVIPDDAVELRIALGVLNRCSFLPCSGNMNTTPWFDNVCFGVYGEPNGSGGFCKLVFDTPLDRPQDTFPTDGTLSLTSPGRIDQGGVTFGSNCDVDPTCNTSACCSGDTLIVRGATGGCEVRVQFAVDPGPGIDTATLNAWFAKHALEGGWCGLSWYSARIDTAELGGVEAPGQWMTTYHEEDPCFSGFDTDTDPNDIDCAGQQTRLANDVFPDDLFTAGSRLMLFYKARDLDQFGNPISDWCVYPDTTGGIKYEMEVLPSSIDSDGDHNCVLYVDNYDGLGAQPLIESALSNLIPGGSENFENTRWDRYDVRGPGTGEARFAHQAGRKNGAHLAQVQGYDIIIWNSGDLETFALSTPRMPVCCRDGLIWGSTRSSMAPETV